MRHTILTTNKSSLISDWLSLFQISPIYGNINKMRETWTQVRCDLLDLFQISNC